jgi:hypothetical protein
VREASIGGSHHRRVSHQASLHRPQPAVLRKCAYRLVSRTVCSAYGRFVFCRSRIARVVVLRQKCVKVRSGEVDE